MTAPQSDGEFKPISAANLMVRLAENNKEIEAAQRLRFHIFCNEMGSRIPEPWFSQGLDVDEFDAVCDHLLVLDTEKTSLEERVVGTYRLLRSSVMPIIGRFYSQSEFDISPVLKHTGEVMELGRSCVLMEYRNRAVMQLLWRGIGAYVFAHKVEMMFGCASFHGQDPKEHAQELSYLYHYHLAPEPIRMRSIEGHYVDMNMIPKDQVNQKLALAKLPPLVKGYLRLGGFVGDGAFIDYEFNTTDVCVIVKTDQVTDRYYQRYSPDPERGE